MSVGELLIQSEGLALFAWFLGDLRMEAEPLKTRLGNWDVGLRVEKGEDRAEIYAFYPVAWVGLLHCSDCMFIYL